MRVEFRHADGLAGCFYNSLRCQKQYRQVALFQNPGKAGPGRSLKNGGKRFELVIAGSDNLIETVGEVVSNPGDDEIGAGVRFVDLDPVEEKLIREYVESQLEG